MTNNRNIYKKIYNYLLEQGEESFLEKNKKEIVNMLEINKQTDLNDIEVSIDDGNEGTVDMPLTEIIIDSITEKIENNLGIKQDIEKLTTTHIQTVLKEIINDLKEEIWNEIHNNTNEINEGITIINYIKKYSNIDSKNIIINSAENFLDYIEAKHTTYKAIENILLAECDNKTLGENIKEYLYEDIGMYGEKILYNIASEHIAGKEIYKRIFDIIEKNTFSTKIIHYILEDHNSIEGVQKRSKYVQNYIKYNYEHIIKCIQENSGSEHKIIDKYKYNQDIQKFIIQNMDTIHDLINQMGTTSIVKNINLLNNLLDTIIDDKFAINIQQLKKSKSYPID